MLIVLCGLLGLLIGSFLNVVIWRLPRGESVSFPPSRCTQCGASIKWYQNVPVVSWLALRGRCAECKTRISPRYPLVELLTAGLFVYTSWVLFREGLQGTQVLVLIPFLYLTAISVALAFIDLDTHTLPNKLTLPAYVVLPVALGALILVSEYSVRNVLIALGGGAALYLFYFILCVAGGMGFGDVKLAGLLGMALGWLGWEYVIVGGFLPFLFGGLFSVCMLIARKVNRKGGIPFGPWMILGYFAALGLAPALSQWYLQNFLNF